MEEEALCRMIALVGADACARLSRAHVMLFGLGGVGGGALEGLVRSGVGRLTLVDADAVHPSNLNRQLLATRESIGQSKCEAAAARARAIAPSVRLDLRQVFATPENISGMIGEARPDYILDAIDTVSAKLEIASVAARLGIPLITCLGTGNKLDPTRLHIGDIRETHTCPLARVMRRELRARGIAHLTVVWSDEPPAAVAALPGENGRHPPASSAFVPPVAGMMMASYAVRALMGGRKEGEN